MTEHFKRRLEIGYKNDRQRSYLFNQLCELRNRNDLDLTGVRSARIIASWPENSAVPNHPANYVEVEDAKKLMKNMGFVFHQSKPLVLEEKKPEEPKKDEEQERLPEEPKKDKKQEKPAEPRANGIYVVTKGKGRNKAQEAVVAYNSIEFIMPLFRRNVLETAEGSYTVSSRDITGVMNASSHRFDAEGRLVLVGLDTLLEKAKSAEADLIAFTPSTQNSPILSEQGAYHFFKFNEDSIRRSFIGYDVNTLKEKLKSAPKA